MLAVPSPYGCFCSILISCFYGVLLRYCPSDFEMAPFAPIITGALLTLYYYYYYYYYYVVAAASISVVVVFVVIDVSCHRPVSPRYFS